MCKIFTRDIRMNDAGSTEANFICIRFERTTKLTSVGQICRNCEVKIVDLVSGATLKSNEQGEIYTKSVEMMLGYYKDEANTKAAFDQEGKAKYIKSTLDNSDSLHWFKLHPTSSIAGWFRTGDLAYYDEDGDFFIVDRLKELIKFRNNIHIPPNTIESVIMKHPSVLEVAVVSRPHKTDGEHPMAFVVKHPNATVIL